jgi:hypothetical protein
MACAKQRGRVICHMCSRPDRAQEAVAKPGAAYRPPALGFFWARPTAPNKIGRRT